MSKIRTEISIESSESFVVKRKRYSIRTWCESCGRITIFVLPTEAGFLAGLDVDTIVSLICSEKLHVYESGRTATYICLSSLCLLNQFSTNPDDHDSFVQTRLKSGFDEQGLLLGDLEEL